MLTICKAIVTGKRKGEQCQSVRSKENEYCGKHQRNFRYEQLINEGKLPCAYFFRGCDTLVSKKGGCDGCKAKYSKKITDCAYEGCKFRTTGDKYCGKHTRQAYHDEEKEKNIKYCDVERSCFTILVDEFSSCVICRKRVLDNETKVRKHRNEIHQALSNDKTTDKQICVNCGRSFIKFITERKNESKLCHGCNEYNARQDAKRPNRDRNFKSENYKNIEAYFKNYIHSAGKRNYTMNIVFEDFIELVKKECFYCGYYKDEEVNGIDRINNDIGYEKTNCVPCCETCNMMKHYFNPLFFIEICRIISGSVKPTKDFYNNWKEYYGRSTYHNYTNYKKETETKRDIKVNITQEDWDKITRQPCYLCGFQDAKGIGIDRVDNTEREYTLDNIKACCGTCNIIKKEFTLEVIKEKAHLISEKWADTTIFESVPRTLNPMREAKRKNEIVEPAVRKIWKAEGVYYDIISNTNEFVETQIVLKKEEYSELLELIKTKSREEILKHIRALLATLNKRRAYIK